MPPSDPRVVPLAVAFEAVAARDADTEAKLRGARWLIDLMADAEETLEL